MVAQPDSSPAIAPSANTMASKRDVPEGAGDGRSASVKSTRISDAAVEMLSSMAPIGDFAALAATPTASVAPLAVAPANTAAAGAAPVTKRAGRGSRSVPPSLQAQQDSPSRRAAGQARSRSPYEDANLELRKLVADLTKVAKSGQEEQLQDRVRITRLEQEVNTPFKDAIV